MTVYSDPVNPVADDTADVAEVSAWLDSTRALKDLLDGTEEHGADFFLRPGASNDYKIKLGDNAGVRKFIIQDSDSIEVASINSNGDLSLAGTGAGAPADATYVVEDANGSLSAESVLGTTVITTAAYGSRQAAAKAGRLFLPNDGFKAERDNGAAWAAWGPIFPLGAQPVSTDFTWINQGGATVTDEKGGMYLATVAGAGTEIRLLKKAAPAAPYTITVCILPTLHYANTQQFGLAFRQSSDGKLHLWGPLIDTTYKWWSAKWTTASAFSTSYLISSLAPYTSPIFLRVADDNTNRVCSFSLDGQHFIPLHTIGRTDFLTADEVGIFIYNNHASLTSGINVISWAQA